MLDIFYDILITLGRRMSFEQVESAGALLGRGLWLALPGRRKLATRAVMERLGLDRKTASALIKINFRHTCQAFLESALTPRVDWRFEQDRLDVTPAERHARMRTDPSPLIFATGHFGAWEFMPRTLRLFIMRERQGIVVRTNRNLALNAAMLRLRGQPRMRVYEHRKSAFSIARDLKQGGGCGLLVDHNCRRDEAIFLPFLGKIAAVNMGPALLAVRAKATIWPVFILRKPGPRYELMIDEPCVTSELTGDVETRVRDVALFYTQAVERVVRAYPEQWFWMHNRWKTRPAEED
jgi:KDO2-lipid IV(A) lauroyltransferase